MILLFIKYRTHRQAVPAYAQQPLPPPDEVQTGKGGADLLAVPGAVHLYIPVVPQADLQMVHPVGQLLVLFQVHDEISIFSVAISMVKPAQLCYHEGKYPSRL